MNLPDPGDQPATKALSTTPPAPLSLVRRTQQDTSQRVGTSTSRASVAGVFDAFLGGKGNYAIDRVAAAMVRKAHPEAWRVFRAEEEFRVRACRYLAGGAGLRQIIVAGSRFPRPDYDPHDVAHRVDRAIRVVYVDDDPLVQAHRRALTYGPDGTVLVVEVDPFDVRTVVHHPEIMTHIDFSEPVGLVHIGTWPYFEGPNHRPAEIMAELVRHVAPGSHIVLSHLRAPDGTYDHTARSIEAALQHSPLGAGTFRTQEEIDALLPGLLPIPPGIVPCGLWYPHGPPQYYPIDDLVVGAIAVKP